MSKNAVLRYFLGRSTFASFGRNFSSTSSLNSDMSFKVQTAEDFDNLVKNSKKPVIVDFFATWCNPCKALTPRLESVIAEKEGKVILAKIDIDEQTELALDYKVASVPVLLAIKDGKVEERLVGLQDTDIIRKFVEKAMYEKSDGKEKAMHEESDGKDEKNPK